VCYFGFSRRRSDRGDQRNMKYAPYVILAWFAILLGVGAAAFSSPEGPPYTSEPTGPDKIEFSETDIKLKDGRVLHCISMREEHRVDRAGMLDCDWDNAKSK
jgi:hypothetical protein